MNLDWNEIFIGDFDFSFALEIFVKTLIMFTMVLLILRLSGKRGVRQLSLFEVAIIIGLGSAAGDPMFNKDVAILPAFMVFSTILGFYRLITYFAAKSEKFENIVEGEPLYIIEDGEFTLASLTEHAFAKDEFFAEMRQKSIEHVGQVRTAVLETNGNISFYYYSDEDVKYGLPVLPKAYNVKSCDIGGEGKYGCTYCGHIEDCKKGTHVCARCKKNEWVKAINTLRIE